MVLTGAMEAGEASTLVRCGDSLRLEVASLTLVVVRGPDLGVEHELAGVPVTLGRGDAVDFPLTDPAVSRRHVRFEPTGSGWKVRDLGSAAGTRIDGVGIDLADLVPGARIRVGDTELSVEGATRSLPVAVPEALEYAGLLGASRVMRELFGLLERLAPLDLPVHLRGASGTGKEGLARALHARGRGGPWVVVDCTLLGTGELARSELFGHGKGAYSGAHEARKGAFERAHGGTLLLDEVGDLALPLQGQLLRVLQQGEVRPLGAGEPRRVKVRVVSATHRDLRAMVAEGSFRADLWHRLAAVVVDVPPLRDREDDVILLARRLLPEGVRLDPEAESRLLSHPWPGNVRELGNVLRTAAALATGGRIRASDLAFPQLPTREPVPGAALLPAGPGRGQGPVGPVPAAATASPIPPRASPPPARSLMESPRRRSMAVTDEAIREALEATGGNREAAAARLGMGRSTFFRRLAKLKLAES